MKSLLHAQIETVKCTVHRANQNRMREGKTLRQMSIEINGDPHLYLFKEFLIAFNNFIIQKI